MSNEGSIALATRPPETALAVPINFSAMEKVVAQGDLAAMSSQQRLDYYLNVCESVGLNPMTRPFEFIELDGKLTLYARRDATDQLRRLYEITVIRVEESERNGMLIWRTWVRTPDGREDCGTAAVPLVKEDGEWKTAQNSTKRYFQGNGQFKPLKPDDYANAIMKAETKSKRRATLAICGLGFLDESEVADVKSARRVRVDPNTGEMQAPEPDEEEGAPAAQAAQPATPRQSNGTTNGQQPHPSERRAAAWETIKRKAAELFPTDKPKREQLYTALAQGKPMTGLTDDEMVTAAEDADELETQEDADDLIKFVTLMGGIKVKLRECYGNNTTKHNELVMAASGGIALVDLTATIDAERVYAAIDKLKTRQQAEEYIKTHAPRPVEFVEQPALSNPDDEMPF